MDAYEPLTTRDRQRAAELATKLEGFNGERRGVEARMLAARPQCGLNEQTVGSFGEPAVVVHGDEGWHPGVLGIVAARLSDAAARPAAVVAFGKSKAGRGSVRAGEGYHAVEALAAASEALAGFGGYRARAAGLQIKPDRLERFKELARRAPGRPCSIASRTLSGSRGSLAFEFREGVYGEHTRPACGLRRLAEGARLAGESTNPSGTTATPDDSAGRRAGHARRVCSPLPLRSSRVWSQASPSTSGPTHFTTVRPPAPMRQIGELSHDSRASLRRSTTPVRRSQGLAQQHPPVTPSIWRTRQVIIRGSAVFRSCPSVVQND